MNPISILLMMIVDTVAQVAAKGQWRPHFDICGHSADLSFRPISFDYSRPTGTWPHTERLEARIVPFDPYDEDEPAQLLNELQAMLAFARRHLDAAPEA